MRAHWSIALFVLSAGCDSADAAPGDGGARDASVVATDARGGADGAATVDGGMPAVDGGDTGTTAIGLPAEGAEVLFSVAVRVAAPASAASVVVDVVDHATLTCTATTRTFECLLDVSTLPAGPFMVRARSLDAAGGEISSATRALVRRDVVDPCAGMMGDRTDCVLALAAAGTAAGFAGVTYIDGDDGHANADTSRMTGIDARILMNPPTMPLADVMLGVVNESRSCSPTGGWVSIPRCTIGRAPRELFDANVLSFWPEHRDHGMRDYYQWHAPYFVLSQGSSGSELDEVNKTLLALGALRPSVRTSLRTNGLVASTVASLLRRSRFTSDLAVMTQEGQVLALGDADNIEEIVTLAAAIRDGELPPIAEVTADIMGTPMAWMVFPTLTTPYAVGFGPFATPAMPPTGRFTINVDLSDSRDADGDELMFFPALLRGDAADVTIVRANERGTLWTITGSFPVDRTIMTGGYDRVVSRVTVGFFPHDGLWLGQPALVSMGGRPAGEIAPDSNNLD